MKKLLLTIILAITATLGHAWTPTKDITIVVGQPPGSATDTVARIVAESFTQQGYSTIVKNQPGALMAIAANQVARSAPDGYTLNLTATSFLFNKLNKNPAATYDLFNDFTHLGTIGRTPSRLYANPTTVTGDMNQVINDIKTGRKKYTWVYASSVAEFTIKTIEEKVKQPITSIPYSGTSHAITDLVGGRVDIIVNSRTATLDGLVDIGKLKLLATAGPKTAGQSTVDQYLPGIIAHSWYGLSLSANASDDVVNFYNNLITKTLNVVDTKEKLAKAGIQLPDQHSIKLESVIARDLARLQPVADRLFAK
jgi:tripartite-type tricarboxylate transporter receptor subunit TctC